MALIRWALRWSFNLMAIAGWLVALDLVLTMLGLTDLGSHLVWLMYQL